MRVFLSSTFIDMQEERDYLVKKIFPSVKAECRRRGVDFVALDLRWGINEETVRSGKVVEICMDEIVRSRPFFIGLIGGRYGWIPKEGDEAITERLLMKYPWVRDCVSEGLSITEMEMQFGVLNNPDPIHAYFFQKNELSISGKYKEKKGSDASRKLSLLKSAVKDAAESGKCGLMSYSSMKELGQQVYDALMAKVEELYPEESCSHYAMCSRLQHEFLDGLRSIYVRYDKAPDLKGKVLVTGHGGIGKSALVANYAASALKKGQHLVYTVINNDVNTVEMCRRMFVYELSLQIQGVDLSVLDQPMDVPVDLDKAFENAQFNGDVLWVIDGLDKLSLSEERACVWLNDRADIIATTSDTSEINPEVLSGFRRVEVASLKPGEIMEITKSYLKGFAKALSAKQVSHIANSGLLTSPQTLKVFLEELLQFGVYEKLEAFIDGYLSANTVEEFYQKVLERFDRDFGAKRMRVLFACLNMCVFGLPEDKIIELLGVNNVEWVAMYTAVLPFVSSSDGYMTMCDSTMSEAVEVHYDLSSLRKNGGLVKRLSSILRCENKEALKLADRRLLDSEGWGVYFINKIFRSASTLYRHSHPAFNGYEDVRYAKNSLSVFMLYVSAGLLRQAMKFAKKGNLSNIMSFGYVGIRGLKLLLEDNRNHISDFLTIGDAKLSSLDETLSISSLYLTLFPLIDDPVRKEMEIERYIRKVSVMPIPESEKQMVISALKGDEEAKTLEDLLDYKTLGFKDVLAICVKMHDVFIISSKDRLRNIAAKALAAAERDGGDYSMKGFYYFVAASAYMRLDNPDADKYMAMSMEDKDNLNNLKTLFDLYDYFKAARNKDYDALKRIEDRTVSYRGSEIMAYETMYYRVRFLLCCFEEDTESAFGKLLDEFIDVMGENNDVVNLLETEGAVMRNVGNHYLAGMFYERAVRECDELRSEDMSRLCRFVGLCAKEDRNVQKAASAFKMALEISDDVVLYDDLEELYRADGDYGEALFWARECVMRLKITGDSDRLAGMYNCLGLDAHAMMRDKNLSEQEKDDYFMEAFNAFTEAERCNQDNENRVIVTNRANLVFEAAGLDVESAKRYVSEYIGILENLINQPDDAGHRLRHICETLARGYKLVEDWGSLKRLRDDYNLNVDVDNCRYNMLYHCAGDKEKAVVEIADDLTDEIYTARTAWYDRKKTVLICAAQSCEEVASMGIMDQVVARMLKKAHERGASAIPYAFAVRNVGNVVGNQEWVDQGSEIICDIIMNEPEACRYYDRLSFLMPLKKMLAEKGWAKDEDVQIRNLQEADIHGTISSIMKADNVVERMIELVDAVLDFDHEDVSWACLNNIKLHLDRIKAEIKNVERSSSDRLLRLMNLLLGCCRDTVDCWNESQIDTLMTVMQGLSLSDPRIIYLKMMTVDDPETVMCLWDENEGCHDDIFCQAEYVNSLRLQGYYEEAESRSLGFIQTIEDPTSRFEIVRQIVLIKRNTGRYLEALDLLEEYDGVVAEEMTACLKPMLLAYTGRPDDALLIVDKYWADTDYDRYSKAVCLIRQGLFSDAEKIVAECDLNDSENPDWMYVLYLIESARYWHVSGDASKAEELMSTARECMDRIHMGMCEYEASQLGLK